METCWVALTTARASAWSAETATFTAAVSATDFAAPESAVAAKGVAGLANFVQRWALFVFS